MIVLETQNAIGAMLKERKKFEPSYVHRFTSAKDFVDKKIEMLKEDFLINITQEDIQWLRSFKTEGEICAAVKGIINKYWK